MVEYLGLVLRWKNALIDPARDLTSIVVREITFEGELATLSAFPADLARWAELCRAKKSLLDLIDLLWLQVD